MDTFTQMNIMLVFGVKYRLGLIHHQNREHIHALLGRLVNEHGKGSKPICVGGTADHVHMLIGLSPNISVADLAREIKSRSSRYINENCLTVGNFAWQNGYGAFSYSQSARPEVIRYIQNQEEHHRRMTFREEVEALFGRFEIAYDPRNLPDAPA